MRSFVSRPAIVAALSLVVCGAIGAVFAWGPAFAAGSVVTIGPFAVVKCASSAACEEYKNSGAGPGVEGVTTSTQVAETGAVYGDATGIGIGVLGQGKSGAGVSGISTTGPGVSATSTSGYGLYSASTSGIGVEAYSGSSNGLSAGSGSAAAIVASASAGGGAGAIEATNTGGSGANGVDATGWYGVIGATTGNGGPILGTDDANNTVFWVDYVGDVNYMGSLVQFSRTRGGSVATSFASQSSSPTIEDDGTGHLVNGVGAVSLDRAFSASIDPSRAYHVSLTPDGDTRGLYVAARTPTSFVVKEAQGGRSTIDFDYHIYAPALGRASERSRILDPAEARAMIPSSGKTSRG